MNCRKVRTAPQLHRRARSTILVAALALAGLTVSTTQAAAGQAPVEPGQLVGADRTVVLPTGAVVTEHPGSGRPSFTVDPRDQTGPLASYSMRTLNGDLYIIPAVAERYLGRGLDVHLFDVTAGTTLPAGGTSIKFTWSAGATPTVPGLTVTHLGNRTGTGYFTRESSLQFGRALAQQWSIDTRTDRDTAGVLGATTISSVVAEAPVAQPQFPQVTLTMTLLNGSGKPTDGQVALLNTDDGRKFNQYISVVDGQAKASVPLGNYSAIADTFIDKGDGSAIARVVAVPDFKVTRNGQTLLLDERAATVSPTVHTPRPAATTAYGLDVLRLDQSGERGDGESFRLSATSRVRVSPTRVARVGQLNYIMRWTLAGASASNSPYSYDLAFRDSGSIPTEQDRTVAPFQLATVSAAYYTDGPARQSGFGRVATYDFLPDYPAFLDALSTPERRTEYVIGDSATTWDAFLGTGSGGSGPGTFVADSPRVYAAGQNAVVDWLRGPLGPGVPQQVGHEPFSCPACRTKDELTVYFDAVTDTTAGHSGSVSTSETHNPSTRLQVYRDGTSIFDQPEVLDATLPVPAGTHTYRVVDTVDRAQNEPTGSTASVVDSTFRSAAGSVGLPAGWTCPLTASTCTVLPMLTTKLPLPTSLAGVLPQGAVTSDLFVAHLQGAANTRIQTAAVSISLDGVAFRPQPVTDLGAGHYRVTITTPAGWANKRITVRTTATDANGGAITTTTTAAYSVAGS